MFALIATILTIAYGEGPQQVGDLYLPGRPANGAPVVLTIHGGGWSAMKRQDIRGIAEYLVNRGCAVYNIDYRLASMEHPWPACGDDCLSAARFVLNGGLKPHGIVPQGLWIVGASAGGHLALWTGFQLPQESIAGIVSISGIADPRPDAKQNPDRYRTLFGGYEPTEEDIDAISILRFAARDCPRVLVTHAVEDTVVPLSSAQNFVDAFREGGRVMFVRYSASDEPNTGGHCIWRKGVSNPRQLLPRIENEISAFMGLKADAVSGAATLGRGLPGDFIEATVPPPLPEVTLKQIGWLLARESPDARDDRWMVGCEVLDRDYARFSAYKDYLPRLGIRSIRLQGGWAKCEKEKGRYDFAWLDEPVDFALAHGLNPVLETDYGNPLYKGGGGNNLAAGFPHGEEGLSAWDRWVDALSRHFAGRVRDWAMWNEPDIHNPADTTTVGGHHTPTNIVAFNVRTARIIRKNIPDARIAGLSLATNDPKFNEDCYKAFGDDIGLFWRFIYHGYAAAPESSYENVRTLKDLCAKYAPNATLWQGENGAPSEMPGNGLALNHIAWSEVTQAKWNMRRMLGDYFHGIPSSVFTICDYYHPGRGLGSYGLLRADTNRTVIAVKQAFLAVRNVATVFDSNVSPVASRVSTSDQTLWLREFTRCGCSLFVFWTCGEFVNVENEWSWKMRHDKPFDGNVTRPAVFTCANEPLRDPVWIDLRTGAVYAFPRNQCVSCAEGTTYIGVPVYDSPCLLTERTAVVSR